MCQVWRLNLKPEPDDNLTLRDVFDFCQTNRVIGVGWREITRTDDYWELKAETEEKYPGDNGVLKALNAMRGMALNDLIYTRFEGKYFLCRVRSKWTDNIPTNQHYRHDINNFVDVEWASIGNEENVPGKVINSFGPAATVQRVGDVEKISKLLWNNFAKNDYRYHTDPIGLSDFWQSISSEDLECLIMLYLQSKGYYVYSTTLKRSTAMIECVMIKNDGSHKCYPQVKRETTLHCKGYEDFLHDKDDKIFLFTTSQDYRENDNLQIECLSLNEIEDFIRSNINLLPAPILNWVKTCNEF